MNGVRIQYRVRQFWHALRARPSTADLELVRQVLAPPLYTLFLSQAPEEQAHSLHLYKRLLSAGEMDPHLLVAALLHDCGKSRFPLRLWERMVIVLGKSFFPIRSRRWGIIDEDVLLKDEFGWRKILWRPFIVAEQHAAWGAKMADQAGADPRAVALIRRHQDYHELDPDDDQDQLLQKLQAVDDES